MNENPLIRHIQYRTYIEEFIISSLVAILGIRLFLKLTDYPQIGGQGLHISHMLWGGLLMFIALILLLTLLNNGVRRVATVIGGLGFGTFIDELGKFVTSDNNYFFQPTFTLIYLIFIMIYLAMHFLERRHEFTEKEYIINSIELFKDAVINDLDTDEKRLAEKYLKKVKKPDQIVDTLYKLYAKLETIPPSPPSTFTKIRLFFRNFYLFLVNKSWFKIVVIVFFLIQAIFSVLIGASLMLDRHIPLISTYLISTTYSTKSYNEIQFYTTLISFGLILIGIFRIYTSRLSAYLYFKRSLLVSILVTQFFAFYYNPLNAFIGLLMNIFIFITLNYMIENEVHLKRKKSLQTD
jgi:hypothetical protein